MKRVVLIAHDTRREAMIRWLRSWRGELAEMELYAAGPFGGEVFEETGLTVRPVATGSCGANEALRRMIEEEAVNLILFFWEPTFRDIGGIDPGAVLSMADRYEIPAALNPGTADIFFATMLRAARSIPSRMAMQPPMPFLPVPPARNPVPDRIAGCLREAGIEPMVTLHRFRLVADAPVPSPVVEVEAPAFSSGAGIP